ncbi:multiple sugar transport system substrate-binding protein [Isoptericola sp. CG 20/1183]|uniref:Multiple sugar transport system substrate-binding protein n=1 Tax=Isoptericola halotolerans TaxID=300560 RepID=A0ABX5EHG9_9MICO|nr:MULTISPECIES: extracellular solute-binding protein [Isoptericola]PRZ08872.1 multiple sugar transport system substrate-binding protein [Isoptericola halotolerans]PRZ10681.1 multiple sugar transport system substrate-binding protein [Isoptericola sp. CG 20/1183]
MNRHTLARSGAAAVAGTLLLAACSGGTDDGGSDGAADASACEPSDGPVELTYTGWVPGMEDAIALWNEANPDIQVTYNTGPAGNAGTYQDFFNQLEADQAPDLGQIEYDTLPNFRVQDGLVNIADCAGVMDAGEQFVDWTWQQVTFGEEGSVYAIPQDTGPMAMFYRADLFEEAGIEVPTTWDEYAEAAQAIRDEGAYITHFPRTDVNWFAGLVWQAEGRWFENDGEAWTVDLTGPQSTQVADYWQGLIDDGLVKDTAGFSDEWNNELNTGELWTWVSAVWGSNSISSGAPDTAGDWAVAPMPQWEPGANAAGNWGGSSVAVLQGSEHPYEAAQFALWLNTSEESLTALNQGGGLYPATTAGLELPALKEGLEFYGDQAIFDVFADAAAATDPSFTWGPTMAQTYNDVADGFGAALSGQGTLLDALQAGQEATISTLESQSIPVAE